MRRIIRFENGTRAQCPMTGRECDATCMWLQSDDDGNYVCSMALIPITDTFSPQVASEFILGQRPVSAKGDDK